MPDNPETPETPDDELTQVMRRLGEVFATLRNVNADLADMVARGVDINDAALLEGLLDDPMKMLEHISASNSTFLHAFEEGQEAATSVETGDEEESIVEQLPKKPKRRLRH